MNGFFLLYHEQKQFMINIRQSYQHIDFLVLISILHLLRCIKSKDIDTSFKNISGQL